MTYTTTPRNVLPNGLTLLQQNPDCAARLGPSAKDHGWLYTRHPGEREDALELDRLKLYVEHGVVA